MMISTRSLAWSAIALLGMPLNTHAQAHRIDTFAGAGPIEIPALQFGLGLVRSVAVDSAGNLYIGGIQHNRIFKVDGAGLLIAFAGNGGQGPAGDGGPAIEAMLDQPAGMAVDASGNLFFADGVARVRRVDAATGIITTVAGGFYGSFGDGGPAIGAGLAGPQGIALGASGDLFIADLQNQRIRRVDRATGTISTVAGTGTRGFNGDGGSATAADLSDPGDVAIDSNGNLLIADTSNQRVRRVDAGTGLITTVAGNGSLGFAGDGGPATSARLANPLAIALDAASNLVISDVSNHRVRRVSATGIIATVAGNGAFGSGGDGGPAGQAEVDPVGLAFDPIGNLHIADQLGMRVRRVDFASGVITTVAGNGTPTSNTGNGDGGPAQASLLVEPTVLALTPAGDLLIADRSENRVRRIEPGGTIATFAGNGSGPSSGDGGPASDAGFNGPTGLAVDDVGNVFVVDQGANKIREVDALSGVITTIAGSGSQGFCGDERAALEACFSNPWALAIDGAGNLYVADTYNNRVARLDSAHTVVTTIAGNGSFDYGGDDGPAVGAALAQPQGVAVDRAGRFLYVADSFNRRVRRVDLTTGIISTFAGNGDAAESYIDGVPATSVSLAFPWGLSLDAEGNLLIAEAAGQVKRVVVSTGLIFRVAGAGSFGFAGDGGAALDAVFTQPTSVVGAAGGALFIADQLNRRVRRVANEPPVAEAGGDQTVVGGSLVHLDGGASGDADGDELSFEWRDGLDTPLGNTAAIDVLATSGSHAFTLWVSDGWGGRTAATVRVTVVGIHINSPEPGANWKLGSLKTISWEHNLGSRTSVRIELSRNGGSSWKVLAACHRNQSDTRGHFQWRVTGPPTTQARVRITSVQGPPARDTSGNFTIR